MRISVIASIAACGLCVVLSAWLFVATRSNASLQLELQKKQQSIIDEQQEYQIRQQKLQAQQEKINAGAQLQQQIGPAVLRDLAALAVQNKNDKIKKLLERYGLELKPNAEGTPAPKP